MSGEEVLTGAALFAIGEAQQARVLFVSPITAWELAVASRKGRVDGRPNLGEDPPAVWFREAIRATGARIIAMQQRISCEAANVVIETGHKDPGDCFLMATARVRRIPIVTRDAFMHSVAVDRPDFLEVVGC